MIAATSAQALPEETEPLSEATARIEAFSRAHVRWLKACAQLEIPDSDDDAFMRATFAEERAALRELFLAPAACSGWPSEAPAMPTIDLTDEEHAAVMAAIRRAVGDDKFPHAPRLDPLRSVLAKLDSAAALERQPPPKAPPPARGKKRPS